MALTKIKPSQRTYNCPFCEYKSKVKRRIESHLHQETGYKTFLCAFCSEDFIKEVELVKHFQKTHSNEKVSFTRRSMPEIEEWIKRFIDFQSSKKYLPIHKYMNKSSRESATGRYFCSICKRFKRDIVTLKRHIFSHFQYRPYKCRYCSFQTVSASFVRVHIQNTHRRKEKDYNIVTITRIENFVEAIINYQRSSHFTKTKVKRNEVCDFTESEKLEKKHKEIQVKGKRPNKNRVLKTISQFEKSDDTLKVKIIKNKSSTDNKNKTCKKQVKKKVPIKKMKTSKKPSLKIKIKKNAQSPFKNEISPMMSTSESQVLEQHAEKKDAKKTSGKRKTSKKYGVRKITLRSNSRMPKDLKLTEHLIMCIKEKCKSQLSAVKPVHQEDSRYTCKEKERVSLPQLKLQAPLINNCSEQKLNNKIDESDICNNKQLELFGGNKKSFGFHYIADHNYTMIAENKIMENKFSFQKVAAKTNVEEQNLHTRLEEMEEVYEEPFITEQLELMDDYVLLEKQSDLYAEQVNKVETTDRNGKQNISGEIIQVCIRKLKQETDINHETKNVNGEWKNQSLKMECHKASRLLKQFDSKRSELFLETLNEEKEENNFQNNYEEALHTSQLEKVKRNLKSVKGNEKRCEMHTQFSCEELKGVKKHENDLLAKFKSPKLLMEEHKINKNISFRKQTEKHPELTQQLNVPENKQEGETCLFSENNQGHFEGIIDSESEFKRSQANVLQFSEKQWQDLKDTVKSKLEIRLKDAVKLHVEEAYMDNQETVKQAVRQQIKNNGTEDMTYLNIKGTFTHEREKDCRSKRPIYKNYLKSKNLKQNEREQRPKKKIKISEEITMHDDSCQIVENKKITFTHKQENLHEGNLGNFIKVKDVRQNMKINSAQKTSWMKLKHSYKGEKGKNLMEELNKNVQPNLNTSTQQDGTSKIKDIFLLNNNKSLNSENDNQNCESKEIDLNKIYLELQNELKDETEKYYYKTTQMQKCRKVQDDQLATDGKKSDNCYKKLKKRKSTTGQNRFKNKIKKLDCSIEELPGNSYRKVKHDSEPTVMHDRRLKKSGTKKSENLIKCWENAEKTTAKVDDQRDDKTSDSVLYANKSEVKYRKYRDHQNKTQNEKWIDSCEKLSYVPLYDVRSLTGTFKAKNLKLNETKNIFSESTDVKFPLKSNPIRSKRNRRPPQCLCCSHATYEDLVKEFKSSQSPACPRIKSGEVNKVCYASPHKKMSLTEQCNICKMCFPNFAELLEHVITKERNVPVSACISDQHIETTHENKTCGPLDFAYSKLSIIHNKEAITSVAGNVLTLEKNKEAITPVPGNVLNLKKNNEAINSVPGNVLKLEKNNEEISLSGNVLKLGQDNEEIVCMPGNVLKLEQNNEAINYVPGNMLKQEQNNEEISVPGNVIKPEQDSECFVITEIKIPITPVSLHCSKGKDYDSAHDNSDEGTHNNIQNPLIEGYRKPPVFFSSISQNEQMFCESKTSEFVKHSESNRLSGSVQLNCTQAERANLKSPVSMNETDDSVPFSVFEIHPGPQVSPDVDTPLTDISHKSEVQSTPSHSSKSPFLSEGHDNPQYEVKNEDNTSFHTYMHDDEDLIVINTASNISALKMYETKLYKCFYCNAGPSSIQKLQQHWQKRHTGTKFVVKNTFLESPNIEYKCSYCMTKEKSLALVRWHCKCCHPNLPVKFIKTKLVDCVPKSVPRSYRAQKTCN